MSAPVEKLPIADPLAVHRPIAGILFCVFALFFFALQDAIIIDLSSRYPLFEVLSLRTLSVLTLLVAIGLWWHGPGILKGRHHLLLTVRGFMAFMAFTVYYVALQQVPLADAASVYMTAPLFVTLLSAALLRERVGFHRWAAVTVGFAAVVVMLNPGSSLFRIESALPLFSALCYAMIPILNRRIGMREHALTMAIYATATYLVCISLLSLANATLPFPAIGNESLARALQPWVALEYYDLGLLLSAAAFFTCGLLGLTQAYRISNVSSVAPFEYSYLVWASLIGFLLFGDIPGARTVIGGAAVVACGCYIIYREQSRARALISEGVN